MQIKEESYSELLINIAIKCIKITSYSTEASNLLKFIDSRLSTTAWKVVSATETPYRLVITVIRNYDERICLGINFDKQGLTTSVCALGYTNAELIEAIKDLLK